MTPRLADYTERSAIIFPSPRAKRPERRLASHEIRPNRKIHGRPRETSRGGMDAARGVRVGVDAARRADEHAVTMLARIADRHEGARQARECAAARPRVSTRIAAARRSAPDALTRAVRVRSAREGLAV